MAQQQKIPNTPPQNALYRAVEFFTNKISDASFVIEPYVVTGPNGSFNMPLNSVVQSSSYGTKVFIPLTTNSGPGANYLKLHIPSDQIGPMYVTFAIKNNYYQDGFYDFINGITESYRTDLKAWIRDNEALTPQTYGKELVFEVYGKDTNQVQSAIEFRVQFNWKYSTVKPPIKVPPTNS